MSITLDTKNTSVCDLVEKLEHFIVFGLKYGNLCKLGCPVVFKNVLKRLPWDEKP